MKTDYKLRVVPDDILHQYCRAVKPKEFGTAKLNELVAAMVSTVKEKDGMGIAAPQVGHLIRVVVIRFDDGSVLPMCNPGVVKYAEHQWLDESCMSLPGRVFRIKRHKMVKVVFCRPDGVKQTLRGTGLLACCLEHEIDHLDGRLLSDIGREIKIEKEGQL